MSIPIIQTTPSRQAVPRRILVANAKGGCGKTTIATNLASYYAERGTSCALIDCDPQASSSQWLKARSDERNPIIGIEAFKTSLGGTRNWAQRLPRTVSRIIVDTPAALQGGELDDQIALADLIIVPVLPSSIDIRAAARFIGNILLSPQYRISKKPILVIANRVRHRTLAINKLNAFLNSLKLPQAGAIRDTQLYIHGAESGIGIAEMPMSKTGKDLNHWQQLHQTIEATLETAPANDQKSHRVEPRSI